MHKTQIRTSSIVLNTLLVIGVICGIVWFSVWMSLINTSKYEQRHEREQSIVQVDTKSGNAPRERLVTLKDNRTVLCLDWAGSLSCDWENAK